MESVVNTTMAFPDWVPFINDNSQDLSPVTDAINRFYKTLDTIVEKATSDTNIYNIDEDDKMEFLFRQAAEFFVGDTLKKACKSIEQSHEIVRDFTQKMITCMSELTNAAEPNIAEIRKQINAMNANDVEVNKANINDLVKKLDAVNEIENRPEQYEEIVIKLNECAFNSVDDLRQKLNSQLDFLKSLIPEEKLNEVREAWVNGIESNGNDSVVEEDPIDDE